MQLPPLEEPYKLMNYCDDAKPSATFISEFHTIDVACCFLAAIYTETQLLASVSFLLWEGGEQISNRKTSIKIYDIV